MCATVGVCLPLFYTARRGEGAVASDWLLADCLNRIIMMPGSRGKSTNYYYYSSFRH